MIFVAAISTPSLTPSTAPLVTRIPIIKGTIARVLIWFPPGVSALAHIKLLWGNYQLFPSNQEADFAADSVLIDWAEDIAITAQPLALTAVTWNDDDAYPHTLTVHVVMEPASTTPSAADVIAQVMAAQGAAPQGPA